MKMKFFIVFILLVWSSRLFGQGSGAILSDFGVLENCGSLLYVAAHPDDENNRLLAYLSKGLHIRTAYLALNRGEGGQNLIGSEQGDALGLIRSKELLAARAADGAEQFFTRAYDFGYSRSPEETLQHWNKDSILADMVWVIRKFRPDVIVNRFPTTGEGGHGHHTASAILSVQAAKEAEDPGKYPEQLRFVRPWKVTRVFFNSFNFGGINTEKNDQLKVDVGGYSTALGKSYGEIAAEGRSSHKSQGFGSAARRGTEIESLSQLTGKKASSLLDGIDQSWKRIAGGSQAAALIASARKELDIEKPHLIVPTLCKAWQAMNRAEDAFYRETKQNQIQKLIQDCLGLWFEASAPAQEFTSNSKITFDVSCLVRTPFPVSWVSLKTKTDSSSAIQDLKFNEISKKPISLQTDSNDVTQPYWLKKSRNSDSYSVDRVATRGLPWSPAPAITLTLAIAGCKIPFQIEPTFKSVNPAKGELVSPVRILPLITLAFETPVRYLTGANLNLQLHVKSREDVTAEVYFILPKGLAVAGNSQNVTLSRGVDKVITLKASVKGRFDSSFVVAARARCNGSVYTSSLHELGYDHTGTLTWLTPSQITVVPLELARPARTIGYIEGAGDKIPEVLQQLGYTVKYIDNEELVTGNLSKYQTIIAGVRAYNVRPTLSLYNARLLDFTAAGGNYIVQYNNPNNVGKQIGPFPFSPGTERITDEHAPFEILKPKSSVLNYPNVIGPKDFTGWVQERGLYYAKDPDSRYELPLAVSEQGTSRLKTSILIAPYGKGNFVYTSLAFFRQLPGGVPGATRLFVNLISLSGRE